jgi:hypothetical protein
MSFRCQRCGKPQPPGTPENKVTVATRDKIYDPRYDEEGELIDKGGGGREIAKEIRVCPECLTK